MHYQTTRARPEITIKSGNRRTVGNVAPIHLRSPAAHRRCIDHKIRHERRCFLFLWCSLSFRWLFSPRHRHACACCLVIIITASIRQHTQRPRRRRRRRRCARYRRDRMNETHSRVRRPHASQRTQPERSRALAITPLKVAEMRIASPPPPPPPHRSAPPQYLRGLPTCVCVCV